MPTSIPDITTNPQFPHPGIRVHKNSNGISVLRLHYSADPAKGDGEKTKVTTIDRELSPWALSELNKMTDQNFYLREYEIEAEATLGRLIFQLDEEATVVDAMEIDPRWTRRMSLDPHPGVPHAFLWVATDPWGDRWYYREMWPSKACFRWDNGRVIGSPGPCPDDEPIIRIRDYVQTIKWLESAENPENTYNGKSFDEKIYARVIDYAARAFGKGTNDDPEQPNFQVRYEQYMQMPDLRLTCPVFQDAKKDRNVGFEVVNAGLKPRLLEVSNGVVQKRSRIHISRNCPELLWQLKNNRRQQLTPVQVQKQDPTGQAVPVRTHQTDNLRYAEMSNPVYVSPERPRSNITHVHEGIAY